MIRSTEQQILLFLSRRYGRGWSIRQIAQGIGVAYPQTYHTIQRLHRSGILHLTKRGNTLFCTLNLDTDLTKNMLAHVDLLERTKAQQHNNRLSRQLRLLKTIVRDYPILTVVAIKTKLLFCVDTVFDQSAIRRTLQEANIRFFGKKDFITYLLTNQQCWEHKLVIHQPEQFYTLLAQHGTGERP